MSKQLQFVIRHDDPLKQPVQNVFQEKGLVNLIVLSEDETAPVGSIVFFTYQGEEKFQFRNKRLRMVVSDFEQHIPEWAQSTPFAIMLKPRKDYDKYPHCFREAVFSAAASYQQYLLGQNGHYKFPWGNEGDLKWMSDLPEGFFQNFETIPNLKIFRRKKFAKSKGKGWGVTKRKAEKVKDITLTSEERLRQAIVVASIGAFNFGVCMELDDSRLHQVYLETVKRLALVAEQAQVGGGAGLYRLMSTVQPEKIFVDMLIDVLALGEKGITSRTSEIFEVEPEKFLVRVKERMQYLAPNALDDLKKIVYQRIQDGETLMMSYYPLVESVLLYGKSYAELDAEQQEICCRYQMSDEFKHFSRIMDPDQIIEVKKQVGTADAGNPRIARLLLYGADYRKRLGIYQPLPMPARILVEEAQFKDTLAPTFVRKNAPYIGAVVTASESDLAKNMIDIMRKLVSQHPLEVCVSMLEDWLMAGKPDPKISITAFQLHNAGSRFLVKVIGIGGGAVTVNNKVIQFPKGGKEYGDLEVGRMDFQHPLHQRVIEVQEGDVIQAVAPNSDFTCSIEDLYKHQLPAGVARVKVNPSRHKAVQVFEWKKEYIQTALAELVQYMAHSKPEGIYFEFGHVHADRDAGAEQETAGYITRIFANMLADAGMSVDLVEPVIDNLHVIDRIDVGRYLEDMTHAYGSPVEDVYFEASLLGRWLGDEMITKLYQVCPDHLKKVGQNIYLHAGPNTMVELYDGVGHNDELPGRQGCVPFMGGYEISRLDPDLASKIWKEIIFERYPDSIIAEWWKEKPDLNFEALTRHFVYGENPERRAALKQQMDEEVDKPYREKILEGNTEFLDRMLEAVNLEKIFLFHILEGTYDGQHTKFAHFMRLAEMLPMSIFRISFDRHTGRIVILDVNNP